jgi:hypothetical protein
MDKEALCVWKGGTSIAKAYGLINRFSSDVDIALLSEQLSQNQQKKLVAKIGHESTLGLMENENAGTIKNNRFRKTYHSYESVIKNSNGHLDFLGTHVIVDWFAHGELYDLPKEVVIEKIIKENSTFTFAEWQLKSVYQNRQVILYAAVAALGLSSHPKVDESINRWLNESVPFDNDISDINSAAANIISELIKSQKDQEKD